MCVRISVIQFNHLYIYLRNMLGNLLRQSSNQLTLSLRQSIVLRCQKKKSIFDTTSYNPQWIPKQKMYHKMRKPRMGVWSDPNVTVPFLIPAMRKICKPRTYLKQVIEEEQRQKAMRKKLFLLEPVRAGDIIDITYQETYENQALTTHRGLVMSFKRRNELTAAIEMVVRMGGMNIKALYLVHSPKIKNIKIVSRGSGNFKSNIKHNWRKTGKNQLVRPRIRNRVMKSRLLTKLKPKVKRGFEMEYDKISSDNVKRIVKL